MQLIKLTKKDFYPVLRAECSRQKLAHNCVFSKIDLRSTYWQFLMSEESIEKTAFCPGPGYGHWDFTVMPYRLTGATQTRQHGLDKVHKHYKDCVDNYVDDCIVFSDSMKAHIKDPQSVLSSLLATGFTLRGFFGRDTITHLGFQYPQEGVTPTEKRSHAVSDWPTPTNKEELRLANFSWRFVLNFADIARPLTRLTGAEVTFQWQDDQQQDFECLMQP